MDTLRSSLIRLAAANPELRPRLLPLLATREAGFNLPDPRGMVKHYRNLQTGLGDLRLWSKTLSVGLAAAGKGTDVELKLRTLKEAEEALAAAVAALQPDVRSYLRSQIPQRTDPRTI